MPQYDDDDDYEPSDCDHCNCWGEGGDCCDCGAENDNWDEDDSGDDDDNYLRSSPFETLPEDDGSDEVGD